MTEPSLINKVSSQRLLAHLMALEGERHPFLSRKHLDAALEYVRSCWQSYGLSVASDEFSYMGERFVNLIARPSISKTIAGPSPDTKLHHRNTAAITDSPCDKNSRGKSDLDQQFGVGAGPRLIIGAHVDTVPGSPGADDNASGVAAMLEVSRLIAQEQLPMPLEFVLFTLEELGMVGSAHYAATLCRAKTPIQGMLSLEMIGFTETKGHQNYPWFLRNRFPDTGNFLGLAGNRRSRSLLETVAYAIRSIDGLPVETLVLPGNGWIFPEARLSDHSPFWDRGYPALLVTDTAFFRNPNYHQPSDTVETLDLAFLEKVTQGLISTIEYLTKR